MDLARMPITEKIPVLRDNNSTPTRSLSRTASICSPTVSSTPGLYLRQSSGFTASPLNCADPESNASGRLDLSADTALPPKKLTSDDIPVLDSFPGYYGFDLYRPLCGDAYEAAETKPSTAFFFFKDENGWTNLYSKKTPTWWTLSYWCQRQPPEGAFLRLTPVYGTSDKQQEVIQRCFEDFMAMPTNSMARYSIVVVGNSSADYFFDPVTERLCVTLPYERPKEGCEYSQFNGRFMCFNSCLYNGGQGNKKPLFLIITLERLVSGTDPCKGQCEVLGRQCIKFRSCACPKRDKENSERRVTDSSTQALTGSGKRHREGERLERQAKKNRLYNFDFVEKSGTQVINGIWSSPFPCRVGHESHDTMADGVDVTDRETYQERELGSPATVNYNGEPYYMMLVPKGLPGAIETLWGVRHGLFKTWSYACCTSRNTNSVQTDVLKQELDCDQSDPHKPHENYNAALQQIFAIEVQLAQLLRDRGPLSLRNQPSFLYGTESADSRSNSNGPMGLVADADATNQTREFSQSCPVGPLSSDSGISTDPMLQQRNMPNSFAHSTQLTNEIFSVPSTGHLNPTFNGTNSANQLANYELDYASRFHVSSGGQPYLPQGGTDVPVAPGLLYHPEILESYALSQHQSSNNNSDLLTLDQGIPLKHPQTPVRSSNLRRDTSISASGAAMTLSVNLNHVLDASAFYPTHYFGNRQGNSEQVSSLLQSFPRSQLNAIQTSSGSGQANFCFYPNAGATNLSDTLLPEDLLTNYLEKDKLYNVTGNDSSETVRHKLQRSPSCSSTSPHSPNSTCCEKHVPLDV